MAEYRVLLRNKKKKNKKLIFVAAPCYHDVEVDKMRLFKGFSILSIGRIHHRNLRKKQIRMWWQS